MGSFRDRLRRVRSEASESAQERAKAKDQEKQRVRETYLRVEEAADAVEAYLESCLRDFQMEFVEFKYESRSQSGRLFRVYWDEPVTRAGGASDKIFHQLEFRVRRYHEYADVEVLSKAIVRNRDRRNCAHEEDVWEGDPEKLNRFIEREIVAFSKLYTDPDGDE